MSRVRCASRAPASPEAINPELSNWKNPSYSLPAVGGSVTAKSRGTRPFPISGRSQSSPRRLKGDKEACKTPNRIVIVRHNDQQAAAAAEGIGPRVSAPLLPRSPFLMPLPPPRPRIARGKKDPAEGENGERRSDDKQTLIHKSRCKRQKARAIYTRTTRFESRRTSERCVCCNIDKTLIRHSCLKSLAQDSRYR